MWYRISVRYEPCNDVFNILWIIGYYYTGDDDTDADLRDDIYQTVKIDEKGNITLLDVYIGGGLKIYVVDYEYVSTQTVANVYFGVFDDYDFYDDSSQL